MTTTLQSNEAEIHGLKSREDQRRLQQEGAMQSSELIVRLSIHNHLEDVISSLPLRFILAVVSF